MLTANDLIRVAELIKLGAETARSFTTMSADGQRPRIADVADRIEAAAEELVTIGHQLNEASDER